MSLLSISVPNFITGVSQQPPALKLPTSVDEMENVWASVVSGASKRPPTEFVANLGTAFVSSAIGNIVNRTGVAQFIIIIADGNLRVFDLQGTEKTVNFPKGKAYLQQATDPAGSFVFINIQDTTFILNKEVVVKANAYGELSDGSYTPDGQVYSFADLPDPDITATGTVYQLTSTGEYYRNTDHPASSAHYDWNHTAGPLSSPSTGDPVVYTLPNNPGSGDIVWLRVDTTNIQWIYTGSGWWPIYVTTSTYDKYEAVETSPATIAYKAWELVTIAELVADLNSGRRNPDQMATVFVTNSVANVYYNVYINGVLEASYLTPDGTSSAAAVPGTSDIAGSLKTALEASGYTVEKNGSTLTITDMNSDDTIEGTSSGGDKLVKCWRNKVPAFADLPPNSPQGRILQVAGDLQSNQDDFYVIFNEGRWEETYGYGAGMGLQASTMPWVLMRNSDGTFTFTQHTWRDRGAGDTNSGRVPSFVENRINDMFLFANRLGFITDTNIILSEVFRYENFFRTTLASLQDNETLDLTVSSKNDDTLRHVIPFNKDLMIMGDKSQYRFQYTQFVGPKNVQVLFTTAFNVSRNVRPANMANSVYFVDDASTYRFGKVFEYYPKADSQGDDADEVTDPIPNYIPAGIEFLTGSPRMEMLAIGTKGDGGSLYIYKFFWAGDKKVQNCWGRWTFTDSDRVYWAGFLDNYLYMLIKRGASVCLERIRTDEEAVDSSLTSRSLLDRMVIYLAGDTDVSYDAGTDYTTITLPYSYVTTPQVVGIGEGETGVRLAVEAVDSTHIKVAGDYTEYSLFAGIPYEMKFTLSTPYIRKEAKSGQVAVLDGRLSVKYLHLVYSKTTYFKVKLVRKGYPTQYVDKFVAFDGNLIDNVDVSLGTTPEIDGQLRVPVLAHNIDFSLSILNDSPFNCILQSGEWWVSHHPRTKII
jgi:hypothetical protein